ncbi:MAG: HEAT repeat domain-containing protein [Myxococcota bacterium]
MLRLPEGQSLSMPCNPDLGSANDEVFLYSGLEPSLSLSFRFDEDAAVQAYGSNPIGSIYLSVGLGPALLDWFEDAPLYIPMEFTAATSDMSRLFRDSGSIQAAFVALGEEMGAAGCELDVEDSTPIVLQRTGHHVVPMLDEAPRRLVFADADAPALHSPEFALKVWCDSLDEDSGSRENRDRLSELLEHRESSIRAAALRGLARTHREVATDLALRLLGDPDWRVRAIAAGQLWEMNPRAMPEALFPALQDPHPEVRLAVADALTAAQTNDVVFAQLLQILREAQGAALGVWAIVACRIGWRPYDAPRRAPLEEALRARIGEVGFPMRGLAAALLERGHRDPR